MMTSPISLKKISMKKIQWYQQILSTMTRVGHTSRLKVMDHSLSLEQFVWSTPITIDDLLRYCWIRFLRIFFTISMMLSLEFQCASKIFFLFVFFSSLIPFYCNSWKEKRERERDPGSTTKLQWQHY